MTEIQQNRYDQLIRRVNNIVAPGSMVSDALSELFPTIDVERVPGELLILGGTDICMGAATVGPLAANAPRMQVFNPVDSGMLITITTCIISVGSTLKVRIATTNTPLTSLISTQVFRDRRRLITARPIGEFRTDLTAAFTDANMLFRLTANAPFLLFDPNGLAVLPPGSGYEIGTDTDNSILDTSFIWRERVAEPAELNF